MLSRKKGESIVIDDGKIVLTVVDVRGDKVRIGISAPPSVVVHRQEVADAIAAGIPQVTKPKSGATKAVKKPQPA